jgi:MHS family proline/betaine transporter-like MFS transporter
VYGYFAASIGKAFFPAEDPISSLLAAFGVFAVGFLARPVGGVLFGHVGDRLGRKRALTLSVALMAVPTVLIGLLPTYAQFGVGAAALLIALRLLQGLSVGGEYTVSIVYVVEHADPSRRGLVGSWAMVGAVAGILLGSAVGAAVATALSDAALAAWGWRIPFLLGLGVGLLGFLLRRQLPEVPVGRATARGSPLLLALRTEGATILRMMAICLASGPVFYILFVYIVTYVEMVDGVAPAAALDVNTLSMLALIVSLLLGGLLSDRLGRKPVAVCAALALLILAWPLFRLLHEPSFAILLLTQMALAGLLGLYCGQQSATLVESLPGAVRCSALALSYNVVVGLFGGLTPMVVTWLVRRTGVDMIPAMILMLVAAIILMALWYTPETRGRALR